MAETVTLDQWIADFPGLQRKTRELWKAIRWEFEQQEPKTMTVRQMFYRMSAGSYVDKTQSGYRRVQRCLLNMRRAGAIPYRWVSDSTRWVRRPTTFNSMSEALDFWQQSYRRSLWNRQRSYVEIWIEKDALAGVFYDITSEYDVPLYVARGYSSETYLEDAADSLKKIGKPVYIYHFGDFDPSGRDSARVIAEKMREFGAQFTFVEAAVTEQQIHEMNLPTRLTKPSDSRSKKWLAHGKESVDVDAIPPNVLRRMVRELIEAHIDRDELEFVRAMEAEERARISELVRGFGTSTNLQEF